MTHKNMWSQFLERILKDILIKISQFSEKTLCCMSVHPYRNIPGFSHDNIRLCGFLVAFLCGF